MRVGNSFALMAAAMLLFSADAARADRLDGDWCRSDGKRMSINGPDITTPGGTRMKGEYARHFFSYVVPAGEDGAGQTVAIRQLSEQLAHARQGSDNAPLQVWNRCQPTVS